MNKASCLSLVSNAVLYWNTAKMSGIVDQFKANGEEISDEEVRLMEEILSVIKDKSER